MHNFRCSFKDKNTKTRTNVRYHSFSSHEGYVNVLYQLSKRNIDVYYTCKIVLMTTTLKFLCVKIVLKCKFTIRPTKKGALDSNTPTTVSEKHTSTEYLKEVFIFVRSLIISQWLSVKVTRVFNLFSRLYLPIRYLTSCYSVHHYPLPCFLKSLFKGIKS